MSKCPVCGEEPGIVTTSYRKWFSGTIAKALIAGSFIACWHYGGVVLVAAYFVLTSLIGLGLVMAKRQGNL